MVAMLTADDVAGILKLSRRSAYTVMRGMPHTEKPLRVTERALTEWVERRTIYPTQTGRKARTTDGTRTKIERRTDR